jgi:hypothetical protein
VEFSLMLLLAAFGGGLFGSAIGGQPAFIFTGFMVFIGIGASLSGSDYDFLTNVAFGPVFGPHISFAGAVAAAAYAARMGQLDSGRDIAAPVMVGSPTPLIIGGLFGMGGTSSRPPSQRCSPRRPGRGARRSPSPTPSP